MSLLHGGGRRVSAALAALLLSGCVSVLPKDVPVTQYRFGESSAPPAGPAVPMAQRFTVVTAITDFYRPSAGERILTTHGERAAYIKGARWVTGAGFLFDAAVKRAFDADTGAARLLARGEPARADYVLHLGVRTFEARYGQNADAPPVIRVELRAALGSTVERTDRVQNFVADVPAAENRVSSIAAAFDQATNKILADLVAWVNAKGEVS